MVNFYNQWYDFILLIPIKLYTFNFSTFPTHSTINKYIYVNMMINELQSSQTFSVSNFHPHPFYQTAD